MQGDERAWEVWGRDRVGALADLCDAALPDERLTADELEACCWDDPSVVVGCDDDAGPLAAAALSVQDHGGVVVGHVKIVVVRPDAQRRGIGRAVLGTLERRAKDEGAVVVQLGGSVPSYLWPSVDVQHLGMLCLAEAAGYQPAGLDLNMALPSSFRSPAPAGVRIERPLDEPLVTAVREWCDTSFPQWTPEVARAIEQGGCHAALDEATGDVLGVGCHSVNRAGWIGPMATEPSRQTGGVGSALLSAVCVDLMVAGHRHGEVSWVGPVRFYAKAGARVSRTFRSLTKTL